MRGSFVKTLRLSFRAAWEARSDAIARRTVPRAQSRATSPLGRPCVRWSALSASTAALRQARPGKPVNAQNEIRFIRQRNSEKRDSETTEGRGQHGDKR